MLVETDVPDAAIMRVRDTLDGVFRSLKEVRDASAQQAHAVRQSGRDLVRADLAMMRPLLFDRLGMLIAGIGFIAAPGLLADAPWYLEWWQVGPSNTPV